MKLGLLGGKLGHSLSPQIHQLFFKYTQKAGTYALLETAAEDLPAKLEELSKSYIGSNVTIPHKVAVMPLLDKIDSAAEAIGAVNTICFKGQQAIGYNTDYLGFARMLEYNKIDAASKVVAILGSGGAARAVVKYFADLKADIYLVTRDVNAVDAYFYKLAPKIKVISYAELSSLQGEVIVNCTPVGMYPKVDASPVTPAVVGNFTAAVDLIYNPQQTLFLQAAQQQGKKAVNGLFMLVAQAVAAQEIWQGEQYDSSLVLQIMQELEQKL